jgi:predicted lipoprotein with Yx(FWY)xxD motif
MAGQVSLHFTQETAMKRVRLGAALLATLLALPALAADHVPLKRQNGMLVDSKGMTVYTFDKDTAGKSNCTGQCTENWPPVKADDAPLSAPWSVVTRDDGSRQLAYKGKPLYTFSKDKKPGDKEGNNVKDVWHVVTD